MPFIARFAAEAAQPQPALKRVEAIERFWRDGSMADMFLRLAPAIAAGMALWSGRRLLVNEWALPGEQMLPVRQGLPHNPTTNMDLELWALSQRAKRDAAARAAVLARGAGGAGRALPPRQVAGGAAGGASHLPPALWPPRHP